MNEFVIDKRVDAAGEGSSPFAFGEYEGAISNSFQCAELNESLIRLPELLQTHDAVLIAGGRNQNIKLTLPFQGSSITVLVKSFGKQKRWKDSVDIRFRGTKAQRSFTAAQHLRDNNVGTPTPIAYVQRIERKRLVESYFISLFEAKVSSFHDELIAILNRESKCSELVPLLMNVACTCRAMHDAGFLHFDLGNQNILLPPDQHGNPRSAQVIDLNRGRVFDEVSLRQRGQDLSRLNVPSALMHMLLDMYWGSPAPAELITWHRRYAKLFSLRVSTRKIRHPIREARLAKERALHPETGTFPDPKNIWIWDDASDQAFGSLDRKDRIKLYPRGRSWRMARDTVAATFSLRQKYKHARESAFGKPVALKDRIGIALEPAPDSQDRELKLLEKLGSVPTLLRFCHHEGRENWQSQAALAQRLHALGHQVKIALVQDRNAVLDPASWSAFVPEVIEMTHPYIESVEIGHAINRVKWGVWDFGELNSLYQPLPAIRRRYPELNITGPATIDFEYAFMMSAMKEWPEEVPVAAISHHLYVDRRGAPENPQGIFNSIDKFALATAIAHHYKVPNGRVEVSEVNWPVAGTSMHSPVTSPFEHRIVPAEGVHDGGVDEATYSDYMLRYLVLALCSGLVDRVYWWRLVAIGYGLVNLEVNGELRMRPAFHTLRHFLHTLGDATFINARLPVQKDKRHGLYEFEFERHDGERLVLCWSHGKPVPAPVNYRESAVENVLGNQLASAPTEISGSPIYFRGTVSH